MTRTFLSHALSLSTFALACQSEAEDPGPDFDPIEASLADVREQVAEGPVRCRTVVARYKELHEARDPELTAIVTWNDRAMDEAARLDALPVAERGALHCAPIVVKDNIDVAGLPTTGGVEALRSSIPAADAPIVARLVDAGAVILGKTNMPDLALDGLDTDSSAFGRTRNPYDATRTVYGSSGGSAAAIAASLGVVALGSDTFGSLIQPGSANGLVALRPTLGKVPGVGVLPLMSLQDAPGPMARSVADAAAVLSVIADGGADYTQSLDPAGLNGLTFGFDPLALQELPLLGLVPDPAIEPMFTRSLAAIDGAGATTREVQALLGLFASLQAAIDGSFKCMPVDFKESFEAYLQSLGPAAPFPDLAALIADGRFSDDAAGFLASAAAQTDAIAASMDCQAAISARKAAAAAITKLMDDEGLDLLVYPAANQQPFTAGEDPPAGWYGFQALSSVTGLPSLTLPMGLTDDLHLPVGLVLLARANDEALLLRAAYALEQSQKPRVAPPDP